MVRGYDLCSTEGRVRYLAVILDAFSRKVVEWSVDRTLQSKLPLNALQKAIANRQPPPGSFTHSEPGCAVRLRSLHPGASGSPDNAEHESARESVRQRQLRKLYEDTQTGGDIRQRLPRSETPSRERREFIEHYYNRCRLHSALGLPPTRRVRRRIKTATR